MSAERKVSYGTDDRGYVGSIESTFTGGDSATCSCGWAGPQRTIWFLATEDLKEHFTTGAHRAPEQEDRHGTA